MTTLDRTDEIRRLRILLAEYPVVSVLGPRQAGKTTLVRKACPGRTYWDLDRPSDRTRLELDPESLLRNTSRPALIDEAQQMPQIFPVLRSLIDERRTARGRFVLLGSASPHLTRGLSESLAGRIAFMELTPFSWREISSRKNASLSRLWERGGFPQAYLAGSDDAWFRWMENYFRTFIERDLGLFGFDLSPQRLHRFVRIMAHVHGNLWNASDVGGSLGISYHTAQQYTDILEQSFLLRVLPPWHDNIKKRLVKRPKIYWRDSGLFHYLLGLGRPADIRDHPKAGASWEGFVIEEIIRRERAVHPSSEFSFFRTHDNLECDLIIKRGARKIPIEIKLAASPPSGTAEDLRNVMGLVGAMRGHIVCRARTTTVARDITLWRADDLLGPGKWKL